MTDQNVQIIESRRYGRVVLFWLVGFFLVFASVDALFVYIAITTDKGVVTQNAYEKGLRYNEILKEARRLKHEGDQR